MAPTAAGSELAVLVTVDGPLARLWALMLGKGFRTSAQADLDRLVALAEADEAARAAVSAPDAG